ncbi:FadR/GntR family transcriptional regulator [Peribacillus glennii]|uniref:FadR family transcriptional regulator n=1 Tax=Peribacillus glennii TaxID=2303991 RepID=A0A372LJF5_9BACI|nr:FadR/GntR family transcriptional regulator [Peribacillus glennii]RFU66590.1 FadR family transcriptional regulator [Peribacillus glennii]
MHLNPVNKNNRMFEQVLDRIQQSISSGMLAPGDKLMTEREFASSLQVSRSSVREALRILEIFDVISSKPGEGTTLKKPNVPKILTKILPFLTYPLDETMELLESRKILEGGIAKLAAKRRKSKDLQNLKEALNRMEKTEDIEERIQADLDFHLFLAKSAYNNTLSDILIVVSDVVSKNLYTTGFQIHTHDAAYRDILNQYYRIYDAVDSKNPQQAHLEMENHLEYMVDFIKKYAITNNHSDETAFNF